MEIRFQAVVDSSLLSFNNITYKNFFDEPYTVKTFKFYIHNIELINTDNNRVFSASDGKYYLIDFADSNSTILKLAVLPFQYNRLSFVIGVDSARNVSGAQTDALDPAKGMFWTWNSGYIMAKLEGNSPVASTPNNVIEYHIGGFRNPNNVIRKIVLSFPLSQTVDFKPASGSILTITANVNSWFFNPHNIKINDQPVCMSPGPQAKQIADNYSKMFTVIRVIKQ